LGTEHAKENRPSFERGGEGLDPFVSEAVEMLRAKQSDEAGYFG
jgi:hypothetical protein